MKVEIKMPWLLIIAVTTTCVCFVAVNYALPQHADFYRFSGWVSGSLPLDYNNFIIVYAMAPLAQLFGAVNAVATVLALSVVALLALLKQIGGWTAVLLGAGLSSAVSIVMLQSIIPQTIALCAALLAFLLMRENGKLLWSMENLKIKCAFTILLFATGVIALVHNLGFFFWALVVIVYSVKKPWLKESLIAVMAAFFLLVLSGTFSPATIVSVVTMNAIRTPDYIPRLGFILSSINIGAILAVATGAWRKIDKRALAVVAITTVGFFSPGVTYRLLINFTAFAAIALYPAIDKKASLLVMWLCSIFVIAETSLILFGSLWTWQLFVAQAVCVAVAVGVLVWKVYEPLLRRKS